MCNLIDKFENDVRKRSRVGRLVLCIDQFFNVLIWNGSQDETISSHIGRRIASGNYYKVEKILCNFLQKIEKSHCKKARGE